MSLGDIVTKFLVAAVVILTVCLGLEGRGGIKFAVSVLAAYGALRLHDFYLEETRR